MSCHMEGDLDSEGGLWAGLMSAGARGGLPRRRAYGPHPYGTTFGPGSFGYTPWSGPAMGPEFVSPIPPEEEKQMLQEQVAYLKGEMEQISRRIEELEQKS